MEKLIPLPTDSLYKFCAMFGLLIIIFCIGSLLYVNESTNNFIFEVAIDYDLLKKNKNRTEIEAAQFDLLEKKFNLIKENKSFYSNSIVLLFVFGILMTSYGFKQWYLLIQPSQDEIIRLTIKKLKQEVGDLD